MPNGYDGLIEDWEKMEAPLLEIDGLLVEFAAERNMQVIKNYHNWPSRSLEWLRDDIHRGIQILAADRPATYHMGLVAWLDRNNKRFGADKWLKKWVLWPEMGENLDRLPAV